MKASSLPIPPRTLLDQVRSTGLADQLLLEVEGRVAKRRKRRRAIKRNLAAAVALLAFGCWLVPFVKDTDAVVVVTEWDEFRNLDKEKMKSLMKTPNILDARNIWDKEEMKNLGFNYVGIGR